jgi:Xaa-Pro dipeptidase
VRLDPGARPGFESTATGKWCSIWGMELVPETEIKSRLSRMRSWMPGSGVDAVFILQNADSFYFSGTLQTGLLCLPAQGEAVFLVLKSLARARLESPLKRQVALPGMRKAPDLLAGEGLGNLRRVGLELDVLPVNHFQRLKQVFAGVEFIDASDAIRNLRMVKSPYEVEQVRRAAAQLNEAFLEIPGWLRAGISELEVAARLEGRLRELGHQGLTRMRGFNNEIGYGTVSIGPSASHPSCFPGPVGFVGLYPGMPNGAGERRLAPGDTVIIDIVGGYGGYIADKTRTFALGEVAPDMAAAHSFVLELLSEIEQLLKPGIRCDSIYQHAIERIKRSPFEENFMGLGEERARFVGHGVGLELDDLPVLASGVGIELQPGMTIAVEPKIFFPGRGGVGVEDTYVITGSGFEKLTLSPSHIIQAAG